VSPLLVRCVVDPAHLEGNFQRASYLMFRTFANAIILAVALFIKA
jgi:hypothetical protein